MTLRRRLPKSARLRSSTEIRAIFRSGRRIRCGGLDLFVSRAANPRNPRIAVVVPKHGRSIVERNSLRRRIRETLRTVWLPAERARSECRDLVVRANSSAYETDCRKLRRVLTGCLEGETC